jgi:hypothetical protein
MQTIPQFVDHSHNVTTCNTREINLDNARRINLITHFERQNVGIVASMGYAGREKRS